MSEAGSGPALEDTVHRGAVAELLGHDQTLQIDALLTHDPPKGTGQVSQVVRVAILPGFIPGKVQRFYVPGERRSG